MFCARFLLAFRHTPNTPWRNGNLKTRSTIDFYTLFRSVFFTWESAVPRVPRHVLFLRLNTRLWHLFIEVIVSFKAGFISWHYTINFLSFQPDNHDDLLSFSSIESLNRNNHPLSLILSTKPRKNTCKLTYFLSTIISTEWRKENSSNRIQPDKKPRNNLMIKITEHLTQ